MQTTPVMTTTPSTIASNAEAVHRCPICFENYTEARFAVAAPECMHSICCQCGIERKSNVCPTCDSKSFHGGYGTEHSRPAYAYAGMPWTSDFWRKNLLSMDIISQQQSVNDCIRREMEARREAEQEKQAEKTARERAEEEKQRLAEELKEVKERYEKLDNDVDNLECTTCKTKEKRERLRICTTCADMKGVDIKSAGDDQMFPFIICAFCMSTAHSGHVIIEYLPWKNNKVINEAVMYGKMIVDGMNELCTYEIEKKVHRLSDWHKALEASDATRKNIGNRQCLELDRDIRSEGNLVCRALDDILRPLRLCNKQLETSTGRLKRLTSEMSGEEGHEALEREVDNDGPQNKKIRLDESDQ